MPDGPLHKNQTGANLHVPGYLQSSDPGAVGAGKYWIDTTGGTGLWALKVRNAGDSGWETVASGGGFSAASQAQQEAGTSTIAGTTPGRQQYHPSACKFWVVFTGSGTPTIQVSYNMTSITDNGTGDYTLNIDIDFSGAEWNLNWGLQAANGGGGGGNAATVEIAQLASPMAAGSVRIRVGNNAGTLFDPYKIHIGGFGDQ